MTTARFALLAPVAAMLTASGAAAQTYRPVDLGSLGGPSVAYAVNASGQGAGAAQLPPSLSFRAARFAAGAPAENLGALVGYEHSIGFAINGAGESFGVSFDLGDVPGASAALKAAPGLILWLGAFEPRACNDAGLVVGSLTVNDALGFNPHACRYQGGALLDLGTLGGSFSEALGVSPGGAIVGSSATSGDGGPHACLWLGGAPIDLGTLGGAKSAAWGVNDAGQIVGYAQTAAGLPHACLWTVTPGGAVLTRTDIGDLGPAGRGYSYARAINARGQTVGSSNGGAFRSRAGVAGLPTSDPIIDLNSKVPPNSGWTLTAAWAANDAGLIVGAGAFAGWPRAVLLVPCAGDVNEDFRIDFADLNALLSAYGLAVPAGTAGDANNDGVVDFADLNALLSNYGSAC